MLGWKMYGKFLQCDECSAVIDRRAKDDFGGQYRDTVARGTFAPSEWPELLARVPLSNSGLAYRAWGPAARHGPFPISGR